MSSNINSDSLSLKLDPFTGSVQPNRLAKLPVYTRKEEIFNCISHGLGILMSIAILVILVAFAAIKADPWRIVAFSVYGFTLLFLYTSSTLYHSIYEQRIRSVLRRFDHSSIYLVIAGSYTPLTLIAMRNVWGWSLFGIVWATTIVGIFLNIFAFEKAKKFSLFVYLAMGWAALLALKPILASVPTGFFFWLLTSGLCYTIGVIFYVGEKIPFNHAIWHIWVLAGSFTYFLGLAFYLA